jgi:glycine cleavage system H protein
MWGKELQFPEEVYYSPELLWVKDESGDLLRLGISDLGVKSVKELLHVRIKSRVGQSVKKHDLIGMVETSKMVWQIIAPVSGVVASVNEKLQKGNPTLLMMDPYGEGWLLQLQRSSETDSELSQLHPGGKDETEAWIAAQAQAIVPLLMEA